MRMVVAEYKAHTQQGILQQRKWGDLNAREWRVLTCEELESNFKRLCTRLLRNFESNQAMNRADPSARSKRRLGKRRKGLTFYLWEGELFYIYNTRSYNKIILMI